MRKPLILSLLFSIGVYAPLAQGESIACPFDRETLTFTGAPNEQARCLLRKVKPEAVLAEPLETLPSPLENLIGQPIAITIEQFQRYLTQHHIQASQLGGELEQPLAHAKGGDETATTVRYFVIHDTSMPNYKHKRIPRNINKANWEYNELNMYSRGDRSKAHMFINRVGESVTTVDFSQPWRATQFEMKYGSLDPQGLFVHIELIQPRKSIKNRPAGNDVIAPSPGFTKPQYQRLVLAYIAASLRKGEWLIPAFHAALDAGVGTHDDPQNFELKQFAHELDDAIQTITHPEGVKKPARVKGKKAKKGKKRR